MDEKNDCITGANKFRSAFRRGVLPPQICLPVSLVEHFGLGR